MCLQRCQARTGLEDLRIYTLGPCACGVQQPEAVNLKESCCYGSFSSLWWCGDTSVRWPQDFWPDAIASSRVFALGEVWHNALVSEVKRYADAIRRVPVLGFFVLYGLLGVTALTPWHQLPPLCSAASFSPPQ